MGTARRNTGVPFSGMVIQRERLVKGRGRDMVFIGVVTSNPCPHIG